MEQKPKEPPLDNRGNPLRVGDTVVFKHFLGYGSYPQRSGGAPMAVRPLGRFVVSKIDYSELSGTPVLVTNLDDSSVIFVANSRSLALSVATELARSVEDDNV